MTTPHISRLNHLHSAAVSLSTTCPAISSHLGTEFHRVALLPSGSPTPKIAHTPNRVEKATIAATASMQKELCGACGAPLIPGHGCVVSVRDEGRQAQRQRGGPRKGARQGSTKVLVQTCGHCGAETRTAIGKPPAAMRGGSGSRSRGKSGEVAAAGDKDIAMDEHEDAVRDGARREGNKGSRARTRARKKGGLAAMVEREKALRGERAGEPSSGFGIGLMDLMKKA